MRRLAHVIEATEVTAVERRLENALKAAGFNVGRLNLTSLAQQVAAEEAKELLVAVNIQPIEAPFFGRGDGGVEVRFVFGTATDHVMAKTVLA
ncbi:50S ribosomal protein L9 domain protein [Brevundimonas diminuta 470-4]|nr:50S ribosomal protein L9 domain protein [Brevundimonas diminuta 470-4]